SEDRQRVQRDSDTHFVPQLTRNFLTFADQRIPRGVISLLAGEHASGKKRACPRLRGSCRSCELQQLTQSDPAFGELLSNLPKTEQRCPETQAPLCISGFCQPLKGRAKIVVFQREALLPFGS